MSAHQAKAELLKRRSNSGTASLEPVSCEVEPSLWVLNWEIKISRLETGAQKMPLRYSNARSLSCRDALTSRYVAEISEQFFRSGHARQRRHWLAGLRGFELAHVVLECVEPAHKGVF